MACDECKNSFDGATTHKIGCHKGYDEAMKRMSAKLASDEPKHNQDACHIGCDEVQCPDAGGCLCDCGDCKIKPNLTIRRTMR